MSSHQKLKWTQEHRFIVIVNMRIWKEGVAAVYKHVGESEDNRDEVE
jgi:hypothetical protein